MVDKRINDHIKTTTAANVDEFIIDSDANGTRNITYANLQTQVKQYVLGDMDEVPTQNSNNPVKSGGIFSAVDDIYSVMGQNGAKNLIPYPYYETTHEDNGITWTVNSDGSVTANGTATANSTFIFRQRTEQTKFVEKNTSYILSGCPSGGSNSKYLLDFFVKNQDDTNVVAGIDYGNGATINVPDQDYYGIYAFARVVSGQTVSNLTFKPMLRLAADTDNTYQPYAMTNKQLTDELAPAREQLAELTANILTGTNIATYNSADNQYTAPTDGYVRFELRNANQYFYLNVNNTTLLGGEGHQVTNANDYISVFIKKGMKLYYTGTVQTAVFYSLVNG